MTKTKQTTDAPEAYSNFLKAMTDAAVPNPLMAPQAEHFWQTQEQLLDVAETFTRSWFERRHEATRTAMKAAREAAQRDGANPGDIVETITDWQRHSMERMIEDAREWLDMMTRCAGITAVSEIEAAEDVLEETRKTTKTAKSETGLNPGFRTGKSVRIATRGGGLRGQPPPTFAGRDRALGRVRRNGTGKPTDMSPMLSHPHANQRRRVPGRACHARRRPDSGRGRPPPRRTWPEPSAATPSAPRDHPVSPAFPTTS